MAGCIRVFLAFGREAVLFVTHLVEVYYRGGRTVDTEGLLMRWCVDAGEKGVEV